MNLRISPISALKTLFDDLSGHNKDEPSPINCDYYDLSIPIPSSSNCNLSIFHLNFVSLSLHKDELVTSLSLLEIESDMIALTETRIRAGIDPTYELSLKGYNHYQTPTECVKGGVIIYIKNDIDVKRRTDLENKMYKSCELESVFLEIVNKGKKNEIFRCIYRHSTMPIDYFNKSFFNEFIERVASENKVSYLSDDFNIDLLKIETDDSISDFYNSLTSHLFVPHITLPTRITSHSQTLVDNIFSNDPNFERGITGNFTFSIADHLAQFLIMPRKDNRLPRKHNLLKRDFKKYDKVELVAEVININWPGILSLELGDPNHSYERFNKKINEVLDTHVPLKKINKNDLRLQAKPWITSGIVKSIKRRDRLLRKYIYAKDTIRKANLHTQCKTLRNQIIAIIRKSKKLHYQKYFTEHGKDIRKTWTGIKNIINFRTMTKGQPTSMMIDNKLIRDPTNIAEGFNNYFSSIAEKLPQNLTFGNNNFDNSCFACGIFIDLQKAFDTVDHQILLKKLEYYGIRGLANNWFRSYLTNRQQSVSVNGFKSTKQTMKYGVPRGSVLGPLLFLIYINDLNKAIKFSTTHHFADDTSILF